LLVAASLFEGGHELGAAIDLDAFDGEGHCRDDLVEEGSGKVCRGASGDACDGPFGDRIVCGEVLDASAGGKVDEDGVDLHDLSGPIGPETLGQAFCMAFADETEAPPARLPAQGRHRHDDAPAHQLPENAADGGDGRRKALGGGKDRQLALAPHRIVGTQVFDRLDQGR